MLRPSAATMHQLRIIYLVTGAVLLSNLVLIFLFVRSAIKAPMDTIISAIGVARSLRIAASMSLKHSAPPGKAF